jgi:hypothetical protein
LISSTPTAATAATTTSAASAATVRPRRGRVVGVVGIAAVGRGSGARRGIAPPPRRPTATCWALGRRAGSLSRQARTMASTSPGTPARSGSDCTTRNSAAVGLSAANGLRPVAANTRVEPSANTSIAGPPGADPEICSGAMYSGVPTTCPVPVSWVPPTDQAIPKSITFGPVGESSTLAGLRSRCTNPPAWIAASASASPPASSTSRGAGSGPERATACASDGPLTYSVANHGGSPSGSASRTRAVNSPATDSAAETSRRNRWRNPVSPARSSRMILIAACRPSGVRPR